MQIKTKGKNLLFRKFNLQMLKPETRENACFCVLQFSEFLTVLKGNTIQNEGHPSHFFALLKSHIKLVY